RAGVSMRYDGRWRDRDPKDAPAGVAPVVRLKAPQSGQTVIQDAVQGEVKVENAILDDMILLRADGTPTYMLAVVVDDQDMGITHVIRGDDHLNNAFRQLQIIHAMGWPEPVYAHIPLIHGPDGAKLSKRHGALGVDAYRDMGFLPAALRNYLLRLGWGHGDDEIISTEQAIEWFDLPGVGRSAARFDLAKLTNLNAHYMRETPDAELLAMVLPGLEAKLGGKVDPVGLERLTRGLGGVKQRSRTMVELLDNLLFYARSGAPPIADDKARAQLTPGAKALLAKLAIALEAEAANWSEKQVEDAIRRFAEAEGVKLGQVAQPLRVALSGSTASPGIFEVLAILGPAETKARLLAASG
ncbi:MAG: glutamate--tRNA ligase, partial [Reyranella sp.]